MVGFRDEIDVALVFDAKSWPRIAQKKSPCFSCGTDCSFKQDLAWKLRSGHGG